MVPKDTHANSNKWQVWSWKICKNKNKFWSLSRTFPFLQTDMGIHSVHQQILPPSGVEFATSLNLTPSTLESSSNVVLRHEFVSRVMCNLVVARSSLLRIFEVREEPAPVVQDEEKDRTLTVRRGTEAVEGEVEMDEQGDGYINIAKVIASSSYALLRVFKSSQSAGC